jgi:hypothetical protein
MLKRQRFQVTKEHKKVLVGFSTYFCVGILALSAVLVCNPLVKATAPQLIIWNDISSSITPTLNPTYENFTATVSLTEIHLNTVASAMTLLILDSTQTYGWTLTFNNDTDEIVLTDAVGGTLNEVMSGIPSSLTINFSGTTLYFNGNSFSNTAVSPSLAVINSGTPIASFIGNGWLGGGSGSLNVTFNDYNALPSPTPTPTVSPSPTPTPAPSSAHYPLPYSYNVSYLVDDLKSFENTRVDIFNYTSNAKNYDFNATIDWRNLVLGEFTVVGLSFFDGSSMVYSLNYFNNSGAPTIDFSGNLPIVHHYVVNPVDAYLTVKKVSSSISVYNSTDDLLWTSSIINTNHVQVARCFSFFGDLPSGESGYVNIILVPIISTGGNDGGGNSGGPTPHPTGSGGSGGGNNTLAKKINDFLKSIPPWLIWVIIAVLLIAGVAGVLKGNKRGSSTPSRSFSFTSQGM